VRADRRPTALRCGQSTRRGTRWSGFAGWLAQDHAEQEFTDELRDLLDRLATHPGVPVQVS